MANHWNISNGKEPATRYPRILDGLGQSLEEPATGYSETMEGLLWHMSQKIVMMVMGRMCHKTVHHTLLYMGLCSQRLVRVPILTIVHHLKNLEWACKGNWYVTFSFLPLGRLSTCGPFTWEYDGARMHCGKNTSWGRGCDSLGNALLRNPRCRHSCGC